MSGIFYAVVEDDPLTSGTGSRVFAEKRVGTITGQDGKARRIAFIGDGAYCPACNTTGMIVGGAPTDKRMIDSVNGGRRQAVGGDFVACKCTQRPKIIPIYGRSFVIRDAGAPPHTQPSEDVTPNTAYDERYTLTNSEGLPLAGVRYRARINAQCVVSGVTDSAGRTQRINTEGARHLTLEIGYPEQST